MEQSLRQLLERSSTDVPYHVQVNISHDIALAVDHLHRNRILHQNLSDYNILPECSLQAKVTGFRKSISLDSNPTLPLPMMPLQGNLLLLPPEAFLEDCYSDKSDCFSVGLLLLYIATRILPSLRLEIHTAVSERAGIKSCLEKVPTFHGVLPVIGHCLKDKSEDRPSAAQLCQRLGQLKTTAAYRKSLTDQYFQVYILYTFSDHCSTHYIVLIQIGDTDAMAQWIIDEAMESGSLQQRNVVGVITGRGKPQSCTTSLVCHLLTSIPVQVLQSSPFEACSTTHYTAHLDRGRDCLTETFVSSLPISLRPK